MDALNDLGYDLLGLNSVIYSLSSSIVDPVDPPCGTGSCPSGCLSTCKTCQDGCQIGKK